MGPLWALEGKLYESECPGDVAVPAAAPVWEQLLAVRSPALCFETTNKT